MSTTLTTPGYGWAGAGVFQKGKGKTLAIPMNVHAANRAKLAGILRSQGFAEGIILLKGGDEQCQYDSDTELVFRQDSWFQYLFGVKEPGMYGAVNIASGNACIFIPRLTPEYEIWCGKIHSPEAFKTSYAVDEICYADEVAKWVSSSIGGGKLHLMDGVNSDSGLRAVPANFEGDTIFHTQGRVELAKLHHALSTARVTKSVAEIEVMRYCAWVASNAHVEVMRMACEGQAEYELEAKFAYEIYAKGGCRKCAYTAICACGPSGAVLHYGHAGAPNDRLLQPGDMCLLDMGAEYHGYVSDITCSYPLSTTFTADQRAIYEGVLNAQRAVASMMGPGVGWPACHSAAEVCILQALLDVGILREGSSIDEMMDLHLGAVFMPHGLGHLIGCDTHDVGGYLEGTPERSTHPGLSKLRTSRNMEVGMVMTSEPGCYFIDALLDDALANAVFAPFIDNTVLQRFRGFGGVRLEDVVMITEAGCENLTTCPRTIAEVESVRQGGQWPPVSDTAPELYRNWMKLDKATGKMVPDKVARG